MRLLVNEIEGKLLNFWMRSWDISHRKPFNVDKESITTNVWMSWMKFYFCTNIPGHWKSGLQVSAFQTKFKRSKRIQITQNLILRWRHACILALHQLCPYERHHSRRCSRWHCSDWNCKHRSHTLLNLLGSFFHSPTFWKLSSGTPCFSSCFHFHSSFNSLIYSSSIISKRDAIVTENFFTSTR